jgi:hypothetical protein
VAHTAPRGGARVAHGRQPSARASPSTIRAFFPLLALRPPKVISLAGGLPCSAQSPSQSRASPCGLHPPPWPSCLRCHPRCRSSR